MYVHCCQNCQPLLFTRPLNWWFRPSRYITITTSLYIYFESWPMMTMFSTWQYEVKMEDVEAAEMVISMRLVVVQCQVWQQCTLRHQSPSTSGHQLNLSPAIQLCNTWTCDMRHVTCYVWIITQYVWLSAIQLCHNWPRQLCSTQLVFSVDQGPTFGQGQKCKSSHFLAGYQQ